MSRSFLHLGALCVVLATPACFIQAPQTEAQSTSALPGDTNGNFTGKSRGGDVAGFLTPEQWVMLMRQARDMAPGERQIWRQEERKKLAAMSETDRQTLQSDLQKQWDALPQDEKNRIQQRLASRMTQQNSGLQ